MVSKAKAPARPKAAAKTTGKAAKTVARKVSKAVSKPSVFKPTTRPVASKPLAKAAKHKPTRPAAVATKPAAKSAPAAAPARIASVKTGAAKPKTTVAVVPAPSPEIAAPIPKSAARPVQTVSPKDLAAAHEYLLTRSSGRSEEPVVVSGRRLPTEEQLLRMPDAEYMNDDQLAFFKYRLQQMERELLSNADETTEHLRETVIVPDPADRATIEEEHALELRTRDRERKLLKKVQSSLQRIDAGEYGFCEETGDPIGIPRLLARPTATLSLEAQQRREMKQRLFGD
ncbi:MAG TPA: RNA polymerase-binding protein DksA [Burkholderiaceae bacterium]|nr:RNA polymerase-binding protein DksA [Burkholderiaceae bacterium]